MADALNDPLERLSLTSDALKALNWMLYCSFQPAGGNIITGHAEGVHKLFDDCVWELNELHSELLSDRSARSRPAAQPAAQAQPERPAKGFPHWRVKEAREQAQLDRQTERHEVELAEARVEDRGNAAKARKLAGALEAATEIPSQAAQEIRDNFILERVLAGDDTLIVAQAFNLKRAAVEAIVAKMQSPE